MTLSRSRAALAGVAANGTIDRMGSSARDGGGGQTSDLSVNDEHSLPDLETLGAAVAGPWRPSSMSFST
jgi:hypothetical protein